jgi:hypothetical protein
MPGFLFGRETVAQWKNLSLGMGGHRFAYLTNRI